MAEGSLKWTMAGGAAAPPAGEEKMLQGGAGLISATITITMTTIIINHTTHTQTLKRHKL